jgi:tRNA U34 5-methylaminomethyl-2-thiouridine-forming methyltransferase MnmC
VRADRKALADELLQASREHDSRQDDRLARFLSVEPETAGLLSLLVLAASAEIDPERTALVRVNLERAALSADLRTADAAELLPGLDDESVDLVFLDAEVLGARDRRRRSAQVPGANGRGTAAGCQASDGSC